MMGAIYRHDEMAGLLIGTTVPVIGSTVCGLLGAVYATVRIIDRLAVICFLSLKQSVAFSDDSSRRFYAAKQDCVDYVWMFGASVAAVCTLGISSCIAGSFMACG